MSDTNEKAAAEKTRASKRADREERRKIREQEIHNMHEDQMFELEDIADEGDFLSDGIVTVKTDEGVIACRKAPAAEMERFNKAINAPAGRRGKRKGPTEEQSIQALVRGSRFYPDQDVFEEIMVKFPICWNTLGDGLVDLAGASFEADVRKN